jgi:hypothetical protein
VEGVLENGSAYKRWTEAETKRMKKQVRILRMRKGITY